MSKIKFSIITLFPEAIRPYLDSSMLYKAQDRQIIEVELINLRDFGLGSHRSVDDTPYGGGDGMLLRCEPVFSAIEMIKQQDPDAEVILPTPVGLTWEQDLVRQFAGVASYDAGTENLVKVSVSDDKNTLKTVRSLNQPLNTDQNTPEQQDFATEEALEKTAGCHGSTNESTLLGDSSNELGHFKHYIILCPHYEGYDERILTIVDHQISLGNYVLTGGELAALIIVDSITRLLPGVLGGDHSALVESFSAGNNLEYPQYTRPEEFRGMKVPEVLLSGNHAAIAKWRLDHSGRKEV